MEDFVREVVDIIVDHVADRLSQITTEVSPDVGLPNDAQTGSSLRTFDDDVQDWTCAICLDEPQHSERCCIVGCGHRYCVTCVVHWASSRPEAARCPTCKAAFSLVSVNKHLDGSMAQSPVQETVAMLARSAWFRTWLAMRESLTGSSRGNAFAIQHTMPRSTYSLMQEEWAEDALYSYFEQEFEEDDVEEYYMGRSNGRRHAFGNRPFGPNGYVRAGRKLAAVPKRPKGKVCGAGGGSSSSCSTSSTHQQTQTAVPKGRRAQRKAKRAPSHE